MRHIYVIYSPPFLPSYKLGPPGANGLTSHFFSGNGYANIGGFIIQWGSIYMTSDVTITFPVPFPTACVGLQTLNDNAQGYQTTLVSFTTTTARLHQSNGAGHNVYILAYGY